MWLSFLPCPPACTTARPPRELIYDVGALYGVLWYGICEMLIWDGIWT